MQGFEDMNVGWAGADYTIPANTQLRLCAKLESIVYDMTGAQATEVLVRKEGPPLSVIAMCYGAALRHAGADVTDDEVFLTIHNGLAESKGDAAIMVQGAIMGLLSVVSPPLARQLVGSGDSSEKKEPAAA